MTQEATDTAAAPAADATLMSDAPADTAAAPAADQASGEAKPTDAPAPDTKADAGDAAKPEGKDAKPDAAAVPEKYEFTAPEGFAIDEALVGEFTPVLKDLGLNQEQAQKLVDFAPRLIERSVDAAVTKTLGDLGYSGCKEWAASAKTDAEFGGEKLTENLAVVRAARDQFASPELRKLLETTPLGNHPEMLRLFYRVGKAITPDGYVPGGKNSGGTNNTAARLYDKSNMNP